VQAEYGKRFDTYLCEKAGNNTKERQTVMVIMTRMDGDISMHTYNRKVVVSKKKRKIKEPNTFTKKKH